MKYFTFCKTAEDCKQLYKHLVKKLHPDNNDRDTTKEFQDMQAEYRQAWDRLKNIHINADGEEYEKSTDETAEEFMDLINKLFRLANIEIELCGAWLWITGDTKACKDQLKGFGFKYASKKQAWYYHRDPWHKHSKGTVSMADIRAKYGSVHFGKREKDQAADPDRLAE